MANVLCVSPRLIIHFSTRRAALKDHVVDLERSENSLFFSEYAFATAAWHIVFIGPIVPIVPVVPVVPVVPIVPIVRHRQELSLWTRMSFVARQHGPLCDDPCYNRGI